MMKKILILSLVFSGLVYAANPAFVQTKNASSVAAVASQTITFNATPGVGNAIIIGTSLGTSNPPSAFVTNVTDNQGNSYSLLQTLPILGGTSSLQGSLWCAIATVSSGTYTITVNLANTNFITVFAREYSNGSCNLDKTSSANGATSPYSCGSFTTANGADFIVTLITNGSAGTVTFTVPTGFSNLDSVTNGNVNEPGAIADKIVTVPTASAPTWTVNVNSSSNCLQVALEGSRAGTGGGGGSVVFP